ncbi:MAG: hypothetical protein RMJ75_07365, partial [Nitrososphaerota archaeon]|nr:hypothetical protein [Nitrososphaerota archaeon]
MISYDAGLNIVPFAIAEGRKVPLVSTWREFLTRRQTVEEFERFSRAPYIAVVCGVGFAGRRLIGIDVDFDKVSETMFNHFFNNFIAVFQPAVQKTPHGVHLYFFTESEVETTTTELFELKGRGALIIVAGEGYEPI